MVHWPRLHYQLSTLNSQLSRAGVGDADGVAALLVCRREDDVDAEEGGGAGGEEAGVGGKGVLSAGNVVHHGFVGGFVGGAGGGADGVVVQVRIRGGAPLQIGHRSRRIPDSARVHRVRSRAGRRSEDGDRGQQRVAGVELELHRLAVLLHALFGGGQQHVAVRAGVGAGVGGVGEGDVGRSQRGEVGIE